MGATTEQATFQPISHVIFDCDGLLVDSERYYTEALTEVAERYGKKFDYQIKADMMGKYIELPAYQ